MIDSQTLQRLQVRDATVFRMRVPAYAREDGFYVPEYIDHFVSRKAACSAALMFEHRGPLLMPEPIIDPVKARNL